MFTIQTQVQGFAFSYYIILLCRLRWLTEVLSAKWQW